MAISDFPEVDIEGPEAYLNRELSWLSFSRRVLALAEDEKSPLLERVKFVGIMGMLHDEFFMKRMSGLKRQIKRGSTKRSIDGRLPQEQFDACRVELLEQSSVLDRLVGEEFLPALAANRLPILSHAELDEASRELLRTYFRESVLPVITPLAVDAEHPFPFISSDAINLAVELPGLGKERKRFVRIKVPTNRPRWVAIPGRNGFVPLEQVIAANLDILFPRNPPRDIYFFRVTRGAEGDVDTGREEMRESDPPFLPGSVVHQVSRELKARRFAGVVRLAVDDRMPDKRLKWLGNQLGVGPADVYRTTTLLRMKDLLELSGIDRRHLKVSRHVPVTHPRLRELDPRETSGIFEEIARGDLLLHHPYQDFDTSVLRFLESAAVDPSVLAIKLTIYRTNSGSPIVRALVDAARRGKQVAVLVEITARFDEAPNIAWGQLLEQEGVHVSYGVERLKTHVKLALVVREEHGQTKRYAHLGTGNYHTGTARIYEDVGILTADPEVCEEVAQLFNTLTGASPYAEHRRILVAPLNMRKRFVELIRREAKHARAGRPSGIDAKMNQLQDAGIIRELYRASQAGVPIRLNVRGLCCLRPGVPGLSENIRVFGVVARFLEHSRIYAFRNGGEPEVFIGSADWMKRNLNGRVETIVSVGDEPARKKLQRILEVYDEDNASVWDCAPDGSYRRRTPGPGEPSKTAQDIFMEAARKS